MRDRRFGRHAAFDQPRRRRRLHDHALAGAASVFGPARRRARGTAPARCRALAHIFADPVQLPAAARAGLVVDIDDDLDARQMGRQRAAIDAALCAPPSRVGRGFGFPPSPPLASLRLLDLFERQQHLVFRQRLGAAAEAMTLHLLDDLDEPLVAHPLGDQHRLELVRIVGKRVDRLRHSRKKTIFSTRFATIFDALIHCVAAHPGKPAPAFLSPRTRRQSSPSSSAENCAADRRITPSAILRPAELAVLQPLREQTHARAVPENQLDPVGALGAEYINRAAEWIGPHRLAHQAPPIPPRPCGSRRASSPPSPAPRRSADHLARDAVCSARKIAVAMPMSASCQIHTCAPPLRSQ